MLEVTEDSFKEGCERSRDLFLLNRLRSAQEAIAGFEAVFDALGLDQAKRERLQQALLDLVPLRGLPVVEATAVASMQAGVLVGLLIADSTIPAEELDLPVQPGA